MLKIIKTLLLLAACCSIGYSYTIWQTTRNGSSSGVCVLNSNKISINVHSFYADVTEEAEISTSGTIWSGDSKTLEITGTFTLSSGCALRSLLLWNGNKILKAKLLLRADADSAYEQVVNRVTVRDPAIVEYLGGNQYRFKIYPVELNGSRKIRILYTVPLQISNEGPQFQISTAFTLGAQSNPNQIPVEIKKSFTNYEQCLLQHGSVKKTVQFGGTYSIPFTDFVYDNYYYYYDFSPKPIIISPVVKIWNSGYIAHIDTGITSGYYSAIFASVPDTISSFIEEENLLESDISLESAISTGSKMYLSDMPGKKFFGAYVKSTTAWDSTIVWTLYNNATGAEIFKYKQKINCVTDSMDILSLPLIWSAKYSLKEGNGALGALFGFVDSKMSLLALESDTLPNTIALQYQGEGVPFLSPEEIIIKPSKRPTPPNENAIIEFDTDILTGLHHKVDFNLKFEMGSLQINFTNQFKGAFKCLIVDASGRVVEKFTSYSNAGETARIKIPRGLKGLYLVQIQVGKERLQKRLILN